MTPSEVLYIRVKQRSVKGAISAVLFGRLWLLFTLVPVVELALLLLVGRQIGFWETVALIVITAAIGAKLAKNQGLGVLRQIQRELNEGRIPANSFLDGIMILVAGALLITPGILTDVFGFLFLIPKTRGYFKLWLKVRFMKYVEGDIYYKRR